jgi:hypothetical protein
MCGTVEYADSWIQSEATDHEPAVVVEAEKKQLFLPNMHLRGENEKLGSFKFAGG